MRCPDCGAPLDNQTKRMIKDIIDIGDAMPAKPDSSDVVYYDLADGVRLVLTQTAYDKYVKELT